MFVYVHGIRYQKLDLAGKGGSSKVYKVLGLNRVIYALKRVRFQNKDQEAVKGFIDEITLLRQLRGKPNIIQLIDAQVFRDDGLVYMVLEYGDIDLARLLHSHEEARRRAAGGTGAGAEGPDAPCGAAGGQGTCQEIDANFIRLYWQQMLQAVKCIHDARIVHADLKPANFMLVQGQLKLIDFGIAKAIQGDTTSINRESQVGTLNYMSPEAIQGGSQNPLGGPPLKVGRPSDVWSLGCILYQMIYGRTPFAELSFIPKMNAICNPSYRVPMPECGEPDAVDCISRCLDRNPKTRISLPELLDHHFLHPNRRKHQPPPQQTAPAAASGSSTATSLTEEQIKAILQLKAAGPPRAAAASAAGGLLPLAGAELHAAILQQRAQLRPVQEAQQPSGPGTGATPIAEGALQPGSARSGGQPNEPVGDGENKLEVALRRGLQRFNFGDSGGDTHGNTEFIEAAMTAARRGT
ncbi:hypothetical protein GPECTOR_4g758 [Gonium pectorale]|uniref:Protein kinase domain-containing protein n=1 Tax=Gonium pectorale TaxID=33097 RepID=A0A150GZC6_GONPE|nr:hypothetical protein GPECTOR_4g758 [Gonium pectorale]|eukprot:KXZ54690.1 hypothetical protein GPECTOR_4g758 [Gonium pectorale]